MKSTKLIPFRNFAERLGQCVRTVERAYARGDADLPAIVWIVRRRFIEEAQADDYIAKIIRDGARPRTAAQRPADVKAVRPADAE